MPVYDYQCRKCGNVIELEHGFNEDPPRKRCLECRGKLNKIFSPVGIVFKGSGFYINDSRKNNGASGNGCVKGDAENKNGKSKEKKEDSSECTSCEQAKSCDKASGSSEKKT